MDRRQFPPAAERFRPLVSLLPSPSAPVIMGGILHAYGLMEEPEGELVWYERILPERFRLDLGRWPALRRHAVLTLGRLPRSVAGARWDRVRAWRAGASRLDARRRLALCKLLEALCFWQDSAAVAGAEPARPAGRLDEITANEAFLRINNRFMLHEPELLGVRGEVLQATRPLLELARRAPAGSRVELIALLKFLTLNLEHGVRSRPVLEAQTAARRALDRLSPRMSAAERLCMESKYWRTVCYVPFFKRRLAEMERQLGEAERAGLAAIEAAREGSEFDRGFARENLHAVVATQAIAALHLKRNADARRALERMVELDPLGAWQRFGLGKTLLALDEAEAGLVQLEAGFALGPPFMGEAHGLMADGLERLGRKAEARRWRAKAPREQPRSAVRAATAAR